jgi:hypothetical protein
LTEIAAVEHARIVRISTIRVENTFNPDMKSSRHAGSIGVPAF